MNRVAFILLSLSTLVLGAPSREASAAPLKPVFFEPSAKPNEFIAHGSGGLLRLTSAGIEFAAKNQPAVRLTLSGARPSQPVATGVLASVSHYYLGNDSHKWRTSVANYSKVRYSSVYPGIDLVFYGSGSSFEYDFEVSPGADPSMIRMRFEGAKKLRLNSAGDLVVGDDGLKQHQPKIHQATHNIAGHFRIHPDRTVSFDIGAYDRSQPLTIDPVVTYISYLGGASADHASNVSVDKSGNVYVTGDTLSSDFPGSVAFGSRTNLPQIAFLCKFGPIVGGKSQLLFTIFLGDNASIGYSQGKAITSDPSGNIIVTGDTSAVGFPTKNPIQTQLAGGLDCSFSEQENQNQMLTCTDAFLAKFSPDGRTLIFSTFYGGKLPNEFDDVTTDAAGNIYAAGFGIGLTDLQGTPNAIQPTATGSEDMLIARFDPNGKVLYSTYLGGSGADQASSIVVEKTGVVWVGGSAHSSNMPLPATNNGVQPALVGNLSNAFVARIDMNQNGASGLTYATYFGGKANTTIAKLFLDPTGQVVFCGGTSSPDLPVTPSAFQNTWPGFPLSDITDRDYAYGDAYMARINPALAGSAGLTYSTFVGGTGSDSATGCGLDPKGNYVVSGFSGSTDLFLQISLGSSIPYKLSLPDGSGADFFLIAFDPTATPVPGQLAAYRGSFLAGGDKQDVSNAMAIDFQGFAYLVGQTLSKQFPLTTNAVQKKYGGDDLFQHDGLGSGDAFLMQVDLNQNPNIPTQLLQESGDFQFGPAGSTLAAPIAIRLADANGNATPIHGYPIKLAGTNFTATPARPLTDGSGIATANVQIIGGDATITATVDITGAEVIKAYTFHLRAFSGTPPKSVAIVSGDKQSAGAGGAVSQPLVVELRDANNAPLAQSGLTIQFKPTNATVGSPTAVTDASGRASTTVKLGAAAGPSTVQVVVGSLTVVTATYTITGGVAPTISTGGIVSAATFKSGAVSPGLIVTIFGSGFGPAVPFIAENAAGSDGKFSTILAATRVLFDGVPGPMIYALAGQTSVIVPYAVAGKTSTQVVVEYQGIASAPTTVPVTTSQLGLFSANASGSGQGALLNQDNSINSAANPAKRNSIIVLFGTGEGQTTPAGVDGLTAATSFPKPNTPITVKINGIQAEVLYYGAAPTLVAGVFQVNVKIPSGFPDMDASIQLFQGAGQSPANITVAVKGDL